MGIKAVLAGLYARFIYGKEQKWIQDPITAQNHIFKELIESGKKTEFGKDHHFDEIHNYEDFKKQVPISDYEDFKPYIEKILRGKENVLWKGLPLYLAKTSGTTSGSKFIPISGESMPFHINAARNALLTYIKKSGNTDFVEGKMIFLQGSPELEDRNGLKIGRLSGISAHYIPQYLQKNRLPSWETNCIEDWETKVDEVVKETLPENMTLISGIPPWLVMYFEKLLQVSGKKTVLEIFPNLSLIVTGGVNYNPYRKKMIELIGKDIDVIQTYPASEGFIAYQDDTESDDLLLLADYGIFYEFIPTDKYFDENPPRLSLEEVETDVDYAVILNTNAGLWGYSLGDTVRFTSVKPYRIIVSGRIKHFTSAFGEHVIAHEVEEAMQRTLAEIPGKISEFTVAPQVNPDEGLPYHEWLIEFQEEPGDLEVFAEKLDANLRKLNTYYDDLISGKVLRPLKVTLIIEEGFKELLQSQGKLGGQNKVPRLGNDRKTADEFYRLKLLR